MGPNHEHDNHDHHHEPVPKIKIPAFGLYVDTPDLVEDENQCRAIIGVKIPAKQNELYKKYEEMAQNFKMR